MSTKPKQQTELTDEERAMMSALLDDNLDDIPDLPDFGVPPKGAYRLRVDGFPYKTVNEKLCVEVQVVVLETRELADPNAIPPKVGMQVTELVWFHNDPVKAKGVLKKKLEAVGEEIGEGNLSKLMERATGMELFGTIDHRKDKEDKDKVYANIVFTGLAK